MILAKILHIFLLMRYSLKNNQRELHYEFQIAKFLLCNFEVCINPFTFPLQCLKYDQSTIFRYLHVKARHPVHGK